MTTKKPTAKENKEKTLQELYKEVDPKLQEYIAKLESLVNDYKERMGGIRQLIK